MNRCEAVLPDNQLGPVSYPDRVEDAWDRCERNVGHVGPHTVRIRLAWIDRQTILDKKVAVAA